MNTNRIETQNLGTRRGFPIYATSPSLSKLCPVQTRDKTPLNISDSKAIIFNDSTGEVTGQGSVAFLEREEVDAEKFVKVYLAGLDTMFKLANSGKTMFKFLWLQVQDNPNIDRVELTYLLATTYGLKTTLRTVNRGIHELLEKEFIYNSTATNLYFFNTDFIFNGNRIVTAKQYDLKREPNQLELDSELKSP